MRSSTSAAILFALGVLAIVCTATNHAVPPPVLRVEEPTAPATMVIGDGLFNNVFDFAIPLLEKLLNGKVIPGLHGKSFSTAGIEIEGFGIGKAAVTFVAPDKVRMVISDFRLSTSHVHLDVWHYIIGIKATCAGWFQVVVNPSTIVVELNVENEHAKLRFTPASVSVDFGGIDVNYDFPNFFCKVGSDIIGLFKHAVEDLIRNVVNKLLNEKLGPIMANALTDVFAKLPFAVEGAPKIGGDHINVTLNLLEQAPPILHVAAEEETDVKKITCAATCTAAECAAKRCGVAAPWYCAAGRSKGGCAATPAAFENTPLCTSCCDSKSCDAPHPPAPKPPAPKPGPPAPTVKPHPPAPTVPPGPHPFGARDLVVYFPGNSINVLLWHFQTHGNLNKNFTLPKNLVNTSSFPKADKVCRDCQIQLEYLVLGVPQVALSVETCQLFLNELVLGFNAISPSGSVLPVIDVAVNLTAGFYNLRFGPGVNGTTDVKFDLDMSRLQMAVYRSAIGPVPVSLIADVVEGIIQKVVIPMFNEKFKGLDIPKIFGDFEIQVTPSNVNVGFNVNL